ncbi:unnamed protein product [Acanthoscelides obtectus]|uniref:DDE Tnp4 domain-containing protein n=1 Tax=Acanthoscelides obtectus TaxID=200917 RepID=A0A9P0P6P1_ACAOB|nr:unnamed protein product [Acanthoscelides obtectus]CAK1648361.1 hypothetical protein AOBTE_LOCUS15689 [Acanthoscelides obtectus]
MPYDPFRNPTPGAEINYNKLLKQERVIIERCFGQLKRRFHILQYVCRVKLENVPKIIIACIVLHNVAKSLGDSDLELVEQDPDEDNGNHENDELPLRQLDATVAFKWLYAVVNNAIILRFPAINPQRASAFRPSALWITNEEKKRKQRKYVMIEKRQDKIEENP